jgi:ribosomal protein S15P/S13E
MNLRINELAMNYFDGNNSKMANILSTSEANIRNYRSNREPKIEFINKIVEHLEINYEWLLAGKGNKFKAENSKTNTDYKNKYDELVIENSILSKKVIQTFEKIMSLQDKINSLNEELEMAKKDIAQKNLDVRDAQIKTAS